MAINLFQVRNILLRLFFGFLLGGSFIANLSAAQMSPNDLVVEFSKTVRPSIHPPSQVISAYVTKLKDALNDSNDYLNIPQYVVLVDRNVHAQLGMIFWGSNKTHWQLVGATAVSTGMPGTFDHFLTPLGVFNHSLDNLDYRAEGTRNDSGFMGYGTQGMRIYDFGWVIEPQTWGGKKLSQMRLQMHATDPGLAENLLGLRRSKGCIRIPSSLNNFIDRYGLLDADYEKAIQVRGAQFWVLRKDRNPVNTPGRFLVVIDSVMNTRPNWNPLPSGSKQ